MRLHNVSSYEASILWSASSEASTNPLDQIVVTGSDGPDLMVTGSGGSGPSSASSSTSATAIDGFIISYRAVNRLSKVSSPFESIENDGMISAGENSGRKSLSMNSNINNNNWETISVSSKMNGYTLRSLRCGTGYRLRVEAFNEMGSGEQSDTLEFSTLGRGKFLLFGKCKSFVSFLLLHFPFTKSRLGRGAFHHHHHLPFCSVEHFLVPMKQFWCDLGKQSAKQRVESTSNNNFIWAN